MLISSEAEGGPGLSSDEVHMMFMTASFFNFIGPLILGIVLDAWGPRACSILSISLIGLGFGLFSISTQEFRCIIPATCLIAFGGPGVQNAIIHISNLFPMWKASATACITGSFQLSFVVFLLFDILWSTYGIGYRSLFAGYCGICVINLLISIFLWPDSPYSFEEQFALLQEENHIPVETPEVLVEMVEKEWKRPHRGLIRLPSEFMQRKEHKGEPHTLSSYKSILNASPKSRRPSKTSYGTSTTQQSDDSMITVTPDKLSSPEYIQLTILFVVTSFWVNFYIGTFDMRLADSGLLDENGQHNFARLFTLIMTCGVVAIPAVGTLMDVAGFSVTSIVMILLGFLWALFLLVNSTTSLLVSFVFYASFRTFLFTFLFAYLADTLGFKYYGILSGTMFAIAGFVSVFQYSLALYASGTCHIGDVSAEGCTHGRWSEVNVIMAVSMCAMFLFSYSDWIRRATARALTQSEDYPVNEGSSPLKEGQLSMAIYFKARSPNEAMFRGFDIFWIQLIPVFMACSGISISFVLKYFDNIVKLLCSSIAVLLVHTVTAFMSGGEMFDICFICGWLLTMPAAYLYYVTPPSAAVTPVAQQTQAYQQVPTQQDDNAKQDKSTGIEAQETKKDGTKTSTSTLNRTSLRITTVIAVLLVVSIYNSSFNLPSSVKKSDNAQLLSPYHISSGDSTVSFHDSCPLFEVPYDDDKSHLKNLVVSTIHSGVQFSHVNAVKDTLELNCPTDFVYILHPDIPKYKHNNNNSSHSVFDKVLIIYLDAISRVKFNNFYKQSKALLTSIQYQSPLDKEGVDSTASPDPLSSHVSVEFSKFHALGINSHVNYLPMMSGIQPDESMLRFKQAPVHSGKKSNGTSSIATAAAASSETRSREPWLFDLAEVMGFETLSGYNGCHNNCKENCHELFQRQDNIEVGGYTKQYMQDSSDRQPGMVNWPSASTCESMFRPEVRSKQCEKCQLEEKPLPMANMFDWTLGWLQQSSQKSFGSLVFEDTHRHGHATNFDSDLDAFLRRLLFQSDSSSPHINTDKMAILLLADHGMHFGPEYMTGTGKIANKQPFAHMILPRLYVESHKKEMNTLVHNSKLLTTHFDLRATVQSWLTGRDTSAKTRRENRPTPKAVAPSLDFASSYGNSVVSTVMNTNRTCEQAGVSTAFCGCDLTPCQNNIRPLVKTQFAAVASFMNHKVFDTSPHADSVCIPLAASDFMFVPGGFDCLTVEHENMRTFEVNLVVLRNNALVGVTFGQDLHKTGGKKHTKESPWYVISVNTASNYGRVWPQCAAQFVEKNIAHFNTIEPTNWQYCYCRTKREINYGPWLKLFGMIYK
eukprot:gene26305-32869_t